MSRVPFTASEIAHRKRYFVDLCIRSSTGIGVSTAREADGEGWCVAFREGIEDLLGRGLIWHDMVRGYYVATVSGKRWLESHGEEA